MDRMSNYNRRGRSNNNIQPASGTTSTNGRLTNLIIPGQQPFVVPRTRSVNVNPINNALFRTNTSVGNINLTGSRQPVTQYSFALNQFSSLRYVSPTQPNENQNLGRANTSVGNINLAGSGQPVTQDPFASNKFSSLRNVNPTQTNENQNLGSLQLATLPRYNLGSTGQRFSTFSRPNFISAQGLFSTQQPGSHQQTAYFTPPRFETQLPSQGLYSTQQPGSHQQTAYFMPPRFETQYRATSTPSYFDSFGQYRAYPFGPSLPFPFVNTSKEFVPPPTQSVRPPPPRKPRARESEICDAQRRREAGDTWYLSPAEQAEQRELMEKFAAEDHFVKHSNVPPEKLILSFRLPPTTDELRYYYLKRMAKWPPMENPDRLVRIDTWHGPPIMFPFEALPNDIPYTYGRLYENEPNPSSEPCLVSSYPSAEEELEQLLELEYVRENQKMLKISDKLMRNVERRRSYYFAKSTPLVVKEAISRRYNYYGTSTFEEPQSSGDETNNTCSICLSEFLNGCDVRRLDCSHLFHTRCVDKWLKEKHICPLCRINLRIEAAKKGVNYPW